MSECAAAPPPPKGLKTTINNKVNFIQKDPDEALNKVINFLKTS